jgi:ubiquinone/menaquinone biosynthesis C-methylase UbiE
MTTRPTAPDFEAVARGFSGKALEYDALAGSDPLTRWLRARIRSLLESRLEPGASILEINAGSGLDAAYFAARGYRVHATDIATGMLQALASKAALPESGGRLTYETLSFTQLDQLSGGPYDAVFSNLGGLNCIGDLRVVTRDLSRLLRPGGIVVLVVMPPVCPWELAQALRGHVRTALRRLRRGVTTAHVEGAQVPVWYHSAAAVRRALGTGFEVAEVRSFCLFAPPSFFHGFIRRHPRLARALMRLDDRLGAVWPFNRAGDFVAVIARRL